VINDPDVARTLFDHADACESAGGSVSRYLLPLAQKIVDAPLD
jgi:hypothetical protein